MGVVNEGIDFTIDVTTCVNHIEISQPAFEGPGSDIELIEVVLGHKFLSLFVTQTWVDQERTLNINFLRHVSQQATPLIVEIIARGDTEAVVLGFVPVILSKICV